LKQVLNDEWRTDVPSEVLGEAEAYHDLCPLKPRNALLHFL
jgi:hypothetical protein